MAEPQKIKPTMNDFNLAGEFFVNFNPSVKPMKPKIINAKYKASNI